MTIPQIREAVVAGLAAALSGVACEPYDGNLTDDDLKRLALRAPALRLAIVAMDDVVNTAGSVIQPELVFGATLVVGDKPGTPRGAGSLAQVQAVLQAVAANRWGEPGKAWMATEIRAENLFSGTVEAKGLSLWLVSWKQRHEVA